MNECFTDPIFGNFSVERKESSEGADQKEEGGVVEERLVIQ